MEMQRSSRAPEAVAPRLQEWLRRERPDAVVTNLQGTSANGMSSETMLFDASGPTARRPGPSRSSRASHPDAADVPVFPSYDLTRQFDADPRGRRADHVPVPTMWWYEPRPERARRAVLRDGAGRRRGPARRHAVQVRRQLAVRRHGRTSSARCRTRRSTCSPSCTRIADAERALRLPRVRREGATPLRRHVAHTRRLVRVRRRRRRARRR